MSKISDASSEIGREKNVENNLMLTFELIWEDCITLKVIYNVISVMMRNSMIARDLRLKRIYAKFRDITYKALQSLIEEEKDLETCTWEVFKENLKNKGLLVLLEELSFTDVEETAFVDAYVSATKDMFISNLDKINNVHMPKIEKNFPESKPTISEEPEYQNELEEVMIIEAESNNEVESVNVIEVEEDSNGNDGKEKEPEAGTSTDQNMTPESVAPKRQCRVAIDGKQAESVGGEINKNSSESQQNEVRKIVNWMREISTARIHHIFNTVQWNVGPYKHMPRSSPVLKAAIALRQVEISRKGLLEIFLELRMNKENNLLFSCSINNISDYYYKNINESIAKLENFLYHQYVTENKVSAFLDRLVEVIDKRNPIINVMFIRGDSDSGKSFFFNCVIHALLNYGLIGNFTAQGQYPLQDCINKRILLWNNPSYVESAEGGLKLLFGGVKINTRVNAETCAIIQRTPIIILSNKKMFHKNESLKQHIYYEEWKKCTYLSKLSKKPYPLAVYYLLIKWKKILVNNNLAKLDAKELTYIQ